MRWSKRSTTFPSVLVLSSDCNHTITLESSSFEKLRYYDDNIKHHGKSTNF
jgi:hypothetical protein